MSFNDVNDAQLTCARSLRREANASFVRRAAHAASLAFAATLLSACRLLPPQPPMDLTEPGWTVREGQAIWRPQSGGADIAGELLVAMHRDGRSLVQFTKVPLPFVIAQRNTNSWQAQFIAQNKSYRGPGRPPGRIVWFQLSDGLTGQLADKHWSFTSEGEGRWHLENPSTGETLEGFLVTTALPKTHTIQSGDTLARITRWYGIPVKSLQATNPGPPSSWLKTGNTIQLPSPPAAP